MTTLSPHRIGFLQYVRAEVLTALDIPTHNGANDHWHPLADLAEPAISRPTDVPTAVIPAIRPPLAAIADVAYQLVDVPHLGVLPIGPLEPAHIHDELIGAGR